MLLLTFQVAGCISGQNIGFVVNFTFIDYALNSRPETVDYIRDRRDLGLWAP